MGDEITVNEWSAEFRWIQTPIGLVINDLSIDGLRTKIEAEPFKIEADKPASWRARIVRDAIQMLLEARAPDNLREIDVRVDASGILVATRAKIVIELPVEALCELEIAEGRQLLAKVKSVSVGGGAGRSLVQQQLDRLNPLIDTANLPLDLRFGFVEYLPGEIIVGGTLAPGLASKTG